MTHETQPLDYQAVPPEPHQRPVRLISHAMTAAALCLVAVWFDWHFGFDASNAARLASIEVVLAIYGVGCATAAAARGATLPRDKTLLSACLAVYAITACVALLLPRLNR
jgi:hypothetical protein